MILADASTVTTSMCRTFHKLLHNFAPVGILGRCLTPPEANLISHCLHCHRDFALWLDIFLLPDLFIMSRSQDIMLHTSSILKYLGYRDQNLYGKENLLMFYCAPLDDLCLAHVRCFMLLHVACCGHSGHAQL